VLVAVAVVAVAAVAIAAVAVAPGIVTAGLPFGVGMWVMWDTWVGRIGVTVSLAVMG
jgi:hypothetical protein